MKKSLIIISLCFFILASVAIAAPLSSDWHADADGDGINKEIDLCPNIYDPLQNDIDNDNIGDLCDDDFFSPIENAPIIDLRIEHVTPYGAWFTFTSPKSTQYGWNAQIAWTTDKTELETTEGYSNVIARGDSQTIGVNGKIISNFGERDGPFIVRDMLSDTKLYAAVSEIHWDGQTKSISNIVEFTTQTSPSLNFQTSSPHIFSSQELISELQTKFNTNDPLWNQYESKLGPKIVSAAANPNSYGRNSYCSEAALLYHVTGNSEYLNAALILLDSNIASWSSGFSGNAYRWADAQLGKCLDLLWNEVSQSKREEAITVMITAAEEEFDPREQDTDEYASIARSLVIDGLVACNAEGISQSVSDQACEVLDEGLRMFYGVQLVKAKRDVGKFAQSGGNLPDGTFYGAGTRDYWFETLWALHNSGQDVSEYMPWLNNQLLSFNVYSMTPSKIGLAPFGDIENFDAAFDNEPNSYPIYYKFWDSLGLQMLLLEENGFTNEAEIANWLLQTFDDNDETLLSQLMMNDANEISDPRINLPTVYADTGMDFLYDRTSWNEDATFLHANAAWGSVDHDHSDAGHFQLFRNGRWVFNEAMGYDGDASEAEGHNVLFLEGNEASSGDGQPSSIKYTGGFLGLSSSEKHSYFRADLTEAYLSNYYHSDYYDQVERHLLWLKGDSDIIVTYDYVKEASHAPSGLTKTWQLHFWDAQPVISGRQANVHLTDGQDVQIETVYPESASLSHAPSQGEPISYPGRLYNDRLLVDVSQEVPELNLVNVIQVEDAGVNNLVDSIGVESDDVIGTLVGNNLVLFPKNPDQRIDSFSVIVPNTLNLAVWVSNVEKNTGFDSTLVELDSQTSELTVTLGNSHYSDDGGLLYIDSFETSTSEDDKIHVAVSGNDLLGDGSVNNPYATLSKAFQDVNPGKTIFVHEGTYTIETQIVLQKSGTTENPIIIVGENAIFEGLNLPNSKYGDIIRVENYDNLVFDNLHFKNGGRAGLSLINADNVKVTNSVFENNGKWGLFTAYAENVYIENNVAFGSQIEHGIYVSNSADNPIVRNNVAYSNADAGIQLNGDWEAPGDHFISNALVENNVLYNNGLNGGAALNLASVSNSVIQNNLLYKNNAGGIALSDGYGPGIDFGSTGNVITNNIVYFNPNEGRAALQFKDGSFSNEATNNYLLSGRNVGLNYGAIEFDSSTIGQQSVIDDNQYYRNGDSVIITVEDVTEYSFSGWKSLYPQYDRNSVVISNPNDVFVSIANDDYTLLEQEPVAVCGNSVVEDGEVCDGEVNSCLVDGYSGTESCNSQCNGYDSCIAIESCGDGVINGNEQCDGSSLNLQTCPLQGFVGGSLSCDNTCQFNTNECNNDINLDDTLVSWLELNGDLSDSSSYDNVVTFFGNTDCSVAGKIGNACRFDGSNDGIIISDSDNLDVDELTLSSWVYVDGYKQDQRIISKETGTRSPWSIYTLLISESGKLEFRLGINNRRQRHASNQVIPLNKWVHVSATYNGNKMKIYIDGELDKEISVSGNIQDNNEPVYIGDSQFYSRSFNGLIDEVRIYDRALSSQEIVELYDGVIIPASVCGNSVVEDGEVCDSEVNSCSVDGYSGTETCNSQCSGFDSCIAIESCGDDLVNGAEVCDSEVNSCTSVDGYSGTESCNPQCSGFSSCISTDFCGDGVINGNEQCDGSSLNLQTCPLQGFVGGSLSCDNTCQFNTNECSNEPRRLETITVIPDQVTILPSNSFQFTTQTIDQYGDLIDVEVSWAYSHGNNITQNGLFSTSDIYTITATSGEISGTAEVLMG
ncbi:hypothetical protein HOC32_05675 [Candidatus Woesearchaeota archaeon]|nr:hypothetical protein [Candidatus Woesearchaeota archaeon]